MADAGQVLYWIRAEVFEQAVLPAVLPCEFSLASLLRLSAECNEAEKISFADWLPAARKILGLDPVLSTALFDTYETLSMPSAKDQLEFSRLELAAWSDPDSQGFRQFRDRRHVQLSLFLLFLFIQLFS
eukprot:403106_1